ncbi:MAG: heavy-metal-associated domain-containing protein [Chloroflexi bacterium]|nr:heavy-metal-associated domain-containing protein [Chloroflexota bacterium]
MSKRITLYAPDISCEHCAMTIKRELAPVEGVISVAVDVPSKTIRLEYRDDASLARSKAVLEEIGYPAAER